ncbi:MAG: ATP-binding protein [Saprospiraceae bacterium]
MKKENVHLVNLEGLTKIFQLIDQVFPFHVIINRELEIIQIGKNFKKIDETFAIGNSFTNHFEIVKPTIETSFKGFSNKEGEAFILSIKREDLNFKGEVVAYAEEGIILFLGTPVISNSEIFLKYNISLADFAAYDSSPDFLFSMQAQENSYREIKSLVKELQRNKIKLLRSNSSLQQFAYVASHDLQSPLRTVVSFAQLLEKKYGSHFDSIGKEYLDFIIVGTKRMQQLINDLLEYGKVEQMQANFEIVDINTLIEKITFDLQFDIKKQKATFEYTNLPSIYVNLTLVKQLFQNLFTNAIKFRQLDDPIIKIDFIERETEWQFSVKDNGIGFDMEDGQKIFEIFQRAVGLESYEGTGIGLAICKRVVEKHKGKIWVESESLKGTTFYFTISKFLSTSFK